MNANQLSLGDIFEQRAEELFLGNVEPDELLRMIDPDQKFITRPDKELIENISKFGILHNLVIFQYKKDGRVFWWIHAGKRRYQAALIAGLDYIPVKILKGNPIIGSGITISENHHRTNNPIAELEAIIEAEREAENQDLDFTDKELAAALGIPISKIEKIRKISRLPEEIIEAIREGRMAIGTAENLAKKSDQIIGSVIEKIAEEPEKRITGKAIEELRSIEISEASSNFLDQIAAQKTQISREQCITISESIFEKFPNIDQIDIDELSEIFGDLLFDVIYTGSFTLERFINEQN